MNKSNNNPNNSSNNNLNNNVSINNNNKNWIYLLVIYEMIENKIDQNKILKMFYFILYY